MSAISETKWKGEKIGRMVVLLLLIGSVKTMRPIHDTPQLIVEAATYPLTVSLWLQQAKLTSSDAAADDQFGTAVAVSGDIAVIGIPYDDDAGSFSGSVDVFSREGTNWNHQQKLTAVDATSFDYFGTSVAVSGDTIVIGASGDDDGGSVSGSVYVFRRSGTIWSQQQKLTANDAAADDQFGHAVAISGDTAIIGAFTDDDSGSQSGSAYVFSYHGTIWNQQQKLTARDAAAYDYFGMAVAIFGDTAVIGAYGDDDNGAGSGSAYIFSYSGTSWIQQQKLIANDAATGDHFGYAVAVSGGTIVIGAYGDAVAGNQSGSAYVFDHVSTTWNQQQKLTANDATADDYFGYAVAVSDDTILIGARFAADSGIQSGSAYLFILSDNTWSQYQKLIASDAETDDNFGRAVTISEDTILIGAPFDDDNGSASGSAYSFTLKPPVNLSIDDVTLSEGDEGLTNFIFTVIRTDNIEAISVNFATTDTTTSASDADYISNSGTINFAAGGSLTKQITIQVIGDNRVEPDEAFFVNLSSASEGIDITDSQGVGNIQNDDTAAVLFMESDGSTNVVEDGSTDIFEIVLTSEPEANVVVILTADSQVILSKKILVFTPTNWNTPQMVTVAAVDTNVNEGDRISTVIYSCSTSDTIYGNFSGTGIIVAVADNDIFDFFLPMIISKPD